MFPSFCRYAVFLPSINNHSFDDFVAEVDTCICCCFQQEKNPNIKCFLIDPPGSGLFNKVTRGVMYTKEEAEGRRLKNPFDTITEGIGVNRMTQNFMMAKLDGAFRGTDREAVEMSRSVHSLLPNICFVFTHFLHKKYKNGSQGNEWFPL